MLELQGFDVQGRDLDLALREVGEVPVLHDDEHIEEGDLRVMARLSHRRGASTASGYAIAAPPPRVRHRRDSRATRTGARARHRAGQEQ